MGKHVLGKIIRWFKGKASFEIRQTGYNFFWQSRYFDHIIRDEQSFHRIRQYIRDNPKNWGEDENNFEN